MPSSSSCAATKQATAIVSEFNKSKKITIDKNGVAPSTVKIPAHRFYGTSAGNCMNGGDKSMPSQPQSVSKSKIEKPTVEKVKTPGDASTSSKMSRSTEFHINDEVLIEFDGEKFYLGIIKDRKNDLVLTRLETGIEQWTPISKLKKLNVTDDQPMCVVCKEYDESVRICAQCRRGFHTKCIELSSKANDECTSSEWQCNVCSTSLALAEKTTKRKELASSCYCGENGDWFMQMLQCARCLNWFHAKCIKCLNFPLYFGDR